MLELPQEGFLERMTEKWFKSRSVCGAETQAAQEAAEEGGDQLHFSDMAGVFITLAVGVAAGMVVLCMELIYASYKDTRSRILRWVASIDLSVFAFMCLSLPCEMHLFLNIFLRQCLIGCQHLVV